jgi:hypothetical protein
MANSLYSKGREAFLEGTIAGLTDTIRLSLFTNTYSPNLSTDQFYSTPLAATSATAGPITLTSVTGSAGTLSAANVVFTSVSGSTSQYLILYKDTGTTTTSPLIGLIDTATGLPVTPNGGNITVAWASGQVFTLFEGLAEDEKDWRVWQRAKELLRHWRGRGWTKPGSLWIPEPAVVVG